MEVFKRYKCIEYGKNNEGKLFLMMKHGCPFVMEDTVENRNSMEEEFNNWKNSFDACDGCGCTTCWHKYECSHWS